MAYKCYISSNGDLNFTTNGRRRVIIKLSEDQRALGPYLPGHPYPYPTDSSYFSGPVDNLSLSTRQYFPRFPLNLQEMAPNLIANAATSFHYWPNKKYLATHTVKFYDDGWTGTNLYNPNAFGCVLLVSAHDTNDDGLNETWDLEPIQNLGANTTVAWVYGSDDGNLHLFRLVLYSFQIDLPASEIEKGKHLKHIPRTAGHPQRPFPECAPGTPRCRCHRRGAGGGRQTRRPPWGPSVRRPRSCNGRRALRGAG